MKSICSKEKCTGCGLCIDFCPQKAITLFKSVKNVIAIIDETKCVKCNHCFKICPSINPIKKNNALFWSQGWSKDSLVRANSSSGGVATELSRYYILNGGVVASCCFIDNEYKYKIAYKLDDLDKFSGSKYVKSNPINIYKEIKKLIDNKVNVLFIGLPCHVAAIKKIIGDSDYILLVDLICHGTPSPLLFNKYISEHKKNDNEFKFRNKGKYGLNIKNNPGITDSYTLSFLYGLNFTENCYSCNYSNINRVSDITLGDSWGSELKSEMKNGISLILCSTNKGVDIIKKINLELHPVDINNAIKNNMQLKEPYKKPKDYEKFMRRMEKNKNYTWSVIKILPIQSIKQIIKLILIKLKCYPKMYDDN